MNETPARSTKSYRYRWTQNNGNLLLAFAGLIFATGLGYIGYQQMNPDPPRFPDSDAIQVPMNPDPTETIESEAVDASSPDSAESADSKPGDEPSGRRRGSDEPSETVSDDAS